MVANSLVLAVWLRPLLNAIWEEAPGANFDVLPYSVKVDPGQVDLVLAGTAPTRTGWDHQALIEDEFVWIARRRRLRSSDKRSPLEQWCARPHVVVADTMPSWVDGWLAARKLTRRVALRVNDFGTVPQLVAETDLVGLVPGHLVEGSTALDRRAPPLPMPTIRGHMWWPRRLGSDPAVKWLRTVVERMVSSG